MTACGRRVGRGPPRPAATLLRVASCAIALTIVGCADAGRPADAPDRSEGTARMAERLVEMTEAIDPQVNIFVNRIRAERLERRIAGATDPAELFRLWGLLAQEQGRAGRTAEALESFARMERIAETHQLDVSANRDVREEIIAITHLRAGGLERCLHERAEVPCLFPIPEARASPDPLLERARRIYTEALTEDPEDYRARWLLNVTEMLAGAWPEGVPARFVIPPEAFWSEFEVGRFADAAPGLGVDLLGHAGANVIEDFDRDGRIDLLASSRGVKDPLRYFERTESGAFVERQAAGLEGLVGGLNMVPADYDNDGWVDVLVLRGGWMPEGFPNSLLRNNGDGTFDDVTVAAGVYSEHPTQTAAWADYDNDGWLDLYIGNESSEAGRHVSELYHADGDGTFTEVAAEVGLDVVGFVKGVAWGDYDNDGLPDLYVSRFREPNLLFHNDGARESGDWRFTDVTERAGVGEPDASFPTWFWDYDNDGWLDLFVSGYLAEVADLARERLGLDHSAEVPRLYRNNRDGSFEDVTARVRLDRILYAMGATYGDLDNDGWLDLYGGTGDPHFRQLMPNLMFRNAKGRVFQDVTSSGGFGHLGKGHGISFGDLDGDGDQDIYAVLGGAYEGDLARNALFENPGHGHRWITLRLEGTESNRSAIGTRIVVRVEEGGETREIHRLVGSGGSFGANTLQTEIGLGRATTIREVEVFWPASGRRDLYRGLGLDRVYDIREGSRAPSPAASPRFDLSP